MSVCSLRFLLPLLLPPSPAPEKVPAKGERDREPEFDCTKRAREWPEQLSPLSLQLLSLLLFQCPLPCLHCCYCYCCHCYSTRCAATVAAAAGTSKGNCPNHIHRTLSVGSQQSGSYSSALVTLTSISIGSSIGSLSLDRVFWHPPSLQCPAHIEHLFSASAAVALAAVGHLADPVCVCCSYIVCLSIHWQQRLFQLSSSLSLLLKRLLLLLLLVPMSSSSSSSVSSVSSSPCVLTCSLFLSAAAAAVIIIIIIIWARCCECWFLPHYLVERRGGEFVSSLQLFSPLFMLVLCSLSLSLVSHPRFCFPFLSGRQNFRLRLIGCSASQPANAWTLTACSHFLLLCWTPLLHCVS